MRVVSLLPAATEIVGALDMLECLVGVSHECDYPPTVAQKARVTRCELHGNALSSGELDRRVRASLQAGADLYTLDEPVLRRLRPHLILTQRLCDVCAVSHGSVRAFAETLPGPPRLVNLEPMRLADVFEDIRRVAAALGVPERGEEVVCRLTDRVERVRARAAAAARRPRCFLLEWTDPLFCAGHWNPELVGLAGGVEVIGRAGEPSRSVAWESVTAARPEVLVLACCGYPVERTLQDLPHLRALPGWEALPAVRSGRVYAVDGSAYFSRPGPRLVDSLEVLAEILHPELFEGWFPERGVRRPA
ncbi:MAG TPA: cobalamin-binding protein [Armatimonadota bacterium]|nr:cobalamin-binding protein [Armatimonadota bacterium]